jgi:aerobic carbon-monoxide dehydrogenase large subunit
VLLEGQVHGGAVQGIGQALLHEWARFNSDGQLLTGSFMDYQVPRAAHVPMFKAGFHNVPRRTNPLGIKGAGETGTIGAPPAIINAIVDALSEWGVRHIDMPATPLVIWRAPTVETDCLRCICAVSLRHIGLTGATARLSPDGSCLRRPAA